MINFYMSDTNLWSMYKQIYEWSKISAYGANFNQAYNLIKVWYDRLAFDELMKIFVRNIERTERDNELHNGIC